MGKLQKRTRSKKHLKIPVCLLLVILLTGCSAGRYYKPQQNNEVFYPGIEQNDVTLIHEITTSCETPDSSLDQRNINTVFVHPGLLWFDFNCKQSMAVESARILIKNGYAKDFQEQCDRNPTRIGEQMQKDPGTRFIGLHYSLGGKPQLIATTLTTVANARQESGKDLLYYPVLVDPFEIEQVNTLLDLNSASLGQMFIVLSAEYSLLRPDIQGIREDILSSPKVHLIYAEDFGENWGHFDELESVVANDTISRFRDIFFLIAETIVNGYSAIEFEGRLALLKMKYAIEDSRPINSSWLRSSIDLPCAQRATQIMAAKAQTP